MLAVGSGAVSHADEGARHLTHPGYGINNLSEVDHVALLLEEHPAVNNYFESHSLLLQAYYKNVGINPDGVFSTDHMQESHKNLDLFWRKQTKNFIDLKINEKTGLNLQEYLNLPYDKIEALRSILEEDIKSSMDTASTVLNSLQNKKL